MTKSGQERRKYLRLEAPIDLRIITEDKRVDKASIINLSPLGLRFESKEKVEDGQMLDLTLILPKAKNPVHIQGKVVWHKKTSLEDNANYDMGCEFTRIEEDNKNTFLKFFCDLIYSKSEEGKTEE